jgi:hypothetical protein
MVIFGAVWYGACVIVLWACKIFQKAIQGEIDLLSPSTVVLQKMPAAGNKKWNPSFVDPSFILR